MLGIIALLVGLAIYFSLEPDEWAEGRRTEYNNNFKKVVTLLTVINKKLPDLTADSKEKKYAMWISDPTYSDKRITTSISQLRQFKTTGFVPDSSAIHEPWRPEQLEVIEQNYGKPIDKNNEFQIRNACDEILACRYFAVLVPLAYQEPSILDDDKFLQGEFDGWVVLVGTQKGEVMGYVRFQAISSEEVSAKRGAFETSVSDEEMNEKLIEDFKNQMVHATSEAIGKIMSK